jgi:hypothetical protein
VFILFVFLTIASLTRLRWNLGAVLIFISLWLRMLNVPLCIYLPFEFPPLRAVFNLFTQVLSGLFVLFPVYFLCSLYILNTNHLSVE